MNTINTCAIDLGTRDVWKGPNGIIETITTHKWAKVTDCSTTGILCECGILFAFGPVELSAGVSTINFRYTDLQTGIAIRF